MPNFKGFHSIDLAKCFSMVQFSSQTDQISPHFDPSKVHQKTRILSTYVARVDIASASGRLWVDIGSTLGRHWVDIGIQIGIPMDSAGYRWWGISVGGDSDRIVLDTDKVFSVCAGYRWWGTSVTSRRTSAP